jgi:hypothetical protein
MLTVTRLTASIMLLLSVFHLSLLAQETATSSRSTPLVTATISTGQIRYLSIGEVKQSRLQVFSSDGIQIFDSGYRDGNLIDWRLTDQQGASLKDGSYIFVVTIKDFSGHTTQKYGAAVLELNQIYLEQANRAQLSQGQNTALESSKEAETLTPVDRMGAAELNRMAGAASGNGAPATQTPGKLEQPGKVDESGKAEQSSASPVNPNLSGTGAQNKIAKWTDNAGTIGNSNIFEDDTGRVGLGTTSPLSQFHLVGSGGAAAITFDTPGSQRFRFMTVPGVPNWGALTINSNYNSGWFLDDPATNGWFFKLDTRGGNAAGDKNGFWLYRVPPGADAHTDEVPVFGVTNGRAYFADNVGIGTINPQNKLEVNGNLKISGAGSGLVFPDGSVMTSANSSGNPSGNNIITALNDPATTGTIVDSRLSGNVPRLNSANTFNGTQTVTGNVSVSNTLLAGTVQSLSGGVKFPDGSIQTSAASKTYTASRNNEFFVSPSGTTPAPVMGLDLPAGNYMIYATIQLVNYADNVFQDNRRYVNCSIKAGGSIQGGGSFRLGGYNDYSYGVMNLHAAVNLTQDGRVDILCGVPSGSTSSTEMRATNRRVSAVRVGDIVVQ